MLDVHRGMSGLAVVAVGLHVAALVADSYLHFGVKEVLVPLASTWRPVPVAAGVVAAWVLAIVQATSLARRRTILGWQLSHRAWRRIHRLSYAAWIGAVGHTITAGTDALRPGIAALGAGATTAVLVYVAVRVSTRRARRQPVRRDLAAPERLPVDVARRR